MNRINNKSDLTKYHFVMHIHKVVDWFGAYDLLSLSLESWIYTFCILVCALLHQLVRNMTSHLCTQNRYINFHLLHSQNAFFPFTHQSFPTIHSCSYWPGFFNDMINLVEIRTGSTFPRVSIHSIPLFHYYFFHMTKSFKYSFYYFF